MRTNYLKTGILGLMIMAGSAINAQQTSGTDATTGNAVGAIEKAGQSKELNGTVRVIDNKGTKKYLQVKNGLTLLTDIEPDGGIVSTWQLGGALSDDTYIDATGKAFSLDGLKLVGPTVTAATAATTQSIGSNATTISGAGTAATETGWTILVRDEETGEISKLLATDLIATGLAVFPIVANDDVAVTATGLAMGTAISKISVYRNGAKLRAGEDYTLTAADTITLAPSATAPNDWTTYAGDIIEVQWIY